MYLDQTIRNFCQCGVGSLGQVLQPTRVLIPDSLAEGGPKEVACGMNHR